MHVHFRDENDGNCGAWRVETPAKALYRLGHDASRSNSLKPLVPEGMIDDPRIKPNCPNLEKIDLVVWQRPTTPNHLGEILQLRDNFGIPVIVEIDDLFLKGSLPPDNPAFTIYHPKAVPTKTYNAAKVGLTIIPEGKNTRMEYLHKGFRVADAITVTTQELADFYRPFNREIYVLPNCWDDTNQNWSVPIPGHEGIYIYFGGSMTHLGDLSLLKGTLETVFKDHDNVKLVVAGDPRVLDLFDIPQEKKLFLGFRDYSEYPLLVRQADIILAPLRDIQFNHGKSDIRVLEAGLCGVPWIGSPLPPYKQWKVGGLLADRPRDWIAGLNRLIKDPDLRASLGKEGFEKARTRAMSANISRWVDTYEKVIEHTKRKRPNSAWAQGRINAATGSASVAQAA